MTDSHLQNTIAFLNRHTTRIETALATAPNPFTGDIACDLFDQGQDALLEEGMDPSEITPLYDNLVAEMLKRCLSPKERRKPISHHCR
jgi:hypothetical protein